ncbi:AAA family ATPase, partial [Candidatus Saccharibacteria bacterium]|nr:AAA family ATPase [Candidatus Saccharibacteria bacterium]NIV71485.1 AAA family ATPase [Calditrichia bacterium]NIV98039.1 AAA family ATPase [Candidatus Saccharibacteria bacterium]NIW78337.1 AAA family ATPase [Calditrichia bacterium]
LQIKGVGYNIFVAGAPGTGKMTSVQSFLEEVAAEKTTPSDWCYVNNFDDQYIPKAIELPPGKGIELENDMDDLIEKVRQELPQAFESEEYTSRREELLSSLNQQRNEISKQINEKATENGFTLQTSPMGIMILPVRDGKPLSEEQFASLPDDEKKEIEEKREEIQSDMKQAMKEIRNLERQAQEKVRELDQQVVLNIVGGSIEDLTEKYEKFPKVTRFLADVQKDIVDNIETFKNKEQQNAGGLQARQAKVVEDLTFRKYRVNVLVDNSKKEGPPVIVELNPTHNNLFGRLEKEMMMGALNTDFTLIKAGSLLRANGGFLVLQAEDVIRNMFSWEGLKRALRSAKVQIEELGEQLGFITTKSLRPKPIPVELKVVLIGEPYLYQLLHQYDNEFPELFKVKADFDKRMEINDENINDFFGFIATYCNKQNLNHFDGDAVTKVMEYACRLAEDQQKMSTEFGQLTDVICEANYWASQDGKSDNALVTAKHVQKALDEKVYRSNLIQNRIEEMMERGTILIDTTSSVVGQVNGLSVLNLGDYEFGKPNRITATVAPGRDGIIDIEREVKLGGPIHSKGVLIISGYLSKKYAGDRPLTLNAHLVFEQSYTHMEGDSASSAELYALLSALSDIPLKQGIAVTGSVNQNGEVQAIGGVNQKIEGFFEVCKKKELTGEQGVIIPESNLKNLMLQDPVIKAIEEKKFHIWAVKTIDQGMELLTDKTAGERRKDGSFPEHTLNALVKKRLQDFEKTLKEIQEKKTS